MIPVPVQTGPGPVRSGFGPVHSPNCNTLFCIVAGRGGCWGGVSQYTRVYCDQGWCETGCIATQCAARPRHDAGLGSRRARWARRACGRRGATALGRKSVRRARSAADEQADARGRRQRRAGRAGQACGRALGAQADARARRREAEARGAAGCALLCAPGRASWASWVLVPSAWFFNPVFRLGIFPESLNEHCSL